MKKITCHNTRLFIGWLTCIPAVLLPHSLCRSTTANAPANRQMPIASVVMCKRRKKRLYISERKKRKQTPQFQEKEKIPRMKNKRLKIN